MSAGWYWLWTCERGCSSRTEHASETLPAGWDTRRCVYDGTTLRAVEPQGATG